jgi:hypothetical protein
MKNTFVNFKTWLKNEAKFDPAITNLKVSNWANKPQLSHSFSLILDKQGNVIPYDYSVNKPHLTIHPKSKSMDLQKLSPQSTEFRRIVNALKVKYPDIQDWTVNHFFMAGHMQAAGERSRTVGYWLSRPEIRLSNKMPHYLYHGTSTNVWYDGIKQKGLVPRSFTGSTGSYGSQNISSLSQGDLVYLSTDPDAATREAAKQAARKHGGKPLILRIDTTGLDINKLEPDEDTKAVTPQASVDISSTLAYKGKIASSNIEPFLLGTQKQKGNRLYDDWEKFYDVPVQEHPMTTKLKKGEAPYSSDPEYYALKDAGLIDRIKKYSDSGHSFEYDVVKNPEEITDPQIKSILKNSGWTQNVKMILNDLQNGYRGVLHQLHNKIIPKELLKDKTIKMLLDSGILTAADYEGSALLSLHGWNAEKYAISLAKILGKTSFQKVALEIKKYI